MGWSRLTALRWASLPAACLCLHSCSLLFEPTEPGLEADAATTEGTIMFHNASFGTADTGLLQFTHTIEPGEGRLLLVSSHTVSSTLTTTSVTFAGTELTQEGIEIEIDVSSDVGEDCNSTLWYVVDPPVGTFDLLATLQSDTKRMVSWAMSFSGVDTFDPIGNLVTATDVTQVETASLNISSSSGELVVDGICFGQPAPARLVAAADQTERVKRQSVDNSLQVAGSTRHGGRERPMSWTHAPGPHTHYSVSLRPAP